MPIIIIASNSEKKLSNAFLRRCLYHYVEFPDKDRLKEIIKARFDDYNEELLNEALEIFINLRVAMKTNQEERENTKLISTSEWIDWCDLIQHNIEKFNQLKDKTLPFAQVLLKSQKDMALYSNLSDIKDQSQNELDDDEDIE